MVIAVDAHKIAYMALPKAGCSSVKAALARTDPGAVIPPADQIRTETWHSMYPTQRFRPHRWQSYASYWRFCVVRDPVRRLMSGFVDRVVERGELTHSRRLARGDFPHLSVTPDPDFFFQNLWEYAEASSVVKHHVAEAWLFLGPGDIRQHYDQIFKTEEMGALAAALSARTGQEVTMPRENSTRTRLTLDDLSPATLDALRPYFAKEYETLAPFYDNPLA